MMLSEHPSSRAVGPVPRERDWHSLLRAVLPYGVWTLADGREVLFDRSYTPTWQRRPGELATVVLDRDWWVPWTRQRYFFDDLTAPWRPGRDMGKHAARQRCQRAFDAFLAGRPVDPFLID